MEKFQKLGIAEPILRAITEQGFLEPTIIQEKSIQLIIDKKDVIGQSATGSGKTLAFGCGIIQNTEKHDPLNAIILTPTRELAEQVCSALYSFSKHKKLSIVSIYGGVAMNPQIKALQSANIVVATPGRLLDHIQRHTINLSTVQTIVLDEADRMIDMGFIKDVEKIINFLPKQRQTILFSATFTPEIKRIEKSWMTNPIRIAGKENVDPSKLHQVYYDVQQNKKFSLLVHLLQNEVAGLVIVFCNTRHQVDFVVKNLKYNNINAIAIHGGFTQAKRNQTIQKFKDNKVEILVCTDVAARGLDISGVSHVYNYDLPNDPKEYVHRIGRTARAGKNGIVINIIAQADHKNFSNILYQHRTMNVQKQQLPEFNQAQVKVEEKSSHRKPQRFGQRRESSSSSGRGPNNRSRGPSQGGSRFPKRNDRSKSGSRKFERKE